MALLFFGGMLPVVFRAQSIYILFLSSALIGIAQGFMHPLASSIICEGWKGEQRRKALGFKQASNYVGASVVALVVGYLAVTGWNNAYLVYLAVVPVFIISYIALPKGELEEKLIGGSTALGGLRSLAKPNVLYLFALFMIATMFSFSFHSNIAMMVSEKGLGDASDVSMITSLNYLVAFVLGMGYGKLSSFARDKTLALGFALLAAGLAISAFASSFPLLLIGGALFGIGSGVQEISTVYYMSREAEKHITIAISLVLVFVNIGITLSPVVISFLKTAIFSSTSAASGMLVGSCGFVVLAAVDLLYRRRRHLREARDLGSN